MKHEVEIMVIDKELSDQDKDINIGFYFCRLLTQNSADFCGGLHVSTRGPRRSASLQCRIHIGAVCAGVPVSLTIQLTRYR